MLASPISIVCLEEERLSEADCRPDRVVQLRAAQRLALAASRLGVCVFSHNEKIVLPFRLL